MKFSGTGTSSFKKFKEYYKSMRKKEQKEIGIKSRNLAEELIKEYFNSTKPKESEKIKKRLERKRVFSSWEQQVFEKLKENRIEFNKKFRKFPIKINDNLTINYEPDSLLEKYEFDGKEIIIEAHEELTNDDIVKYSTFMKNYFSVFHLIMIVNEHELRKWNGFDSSNRLFNDIWTINDLKDLINWIKRQNIKEEDFVTQTKCPHCTTTAVGSKQINSFFGFRKKKNGESFPQALCRECRRLQLKLGTDGLKDFLEQSRRELVIEVQRFCTGCDNYFETKIPDEAFCVECNKKYWNKV